MGGWPLYDPNGDALAIGTEWLYSQFASGNLAATYAYDTADDQGELQKAIWWLEEETSAPGYATGSQNTWVELAKAELSLLDDVLIRADANGAYGVVALNLDPVGGDSARRQDVLAVPDGGLTLGLLGFGLLAVGWTRRRSA